MNAICEECIRKKLFGKKCKYYWAGKKECGSKCYSRSEMLELDAMRTGSM